MRTLLVAALLWSAGVSAAANMLDPAQEQRYSHLISELRCLVCQNQTIAESNAGLAKDLRSQVRTQILEGRTDQEILAYMTDRYGDFVRYRPPLKLKTVLLWGAPLLLLGLGLLVFWRTTRKAALIAPVAEPDPAALKRLLASRKENNS